MTKEEKERTESKAKAVEFLSSNKRFIVVGIADDGKMDAVISAHVLDVVKAERLLHGMVNQLIGLKEIK